MMRLLKFLLPLVGRRKTALATSLVVLVGASFFVFAPSAYAGFGEDVMQGMIHATIWSVGKLAELWVWFIGQILIVVIKILLQVAQYNSFVVSTAVSEGWRIVRDVTNMFFVIYLLMIAIGTITGMQGGKYSWEKTLPKFIAAAIIINFSKTICGILIDAAQIVMLTFVGAFAETGAGAGNFVALLGIPQLLNMPPDPGIVTGPAGLAVICGMILAAILATVACMVMIIMVMLLLFRIVTLWFLIVLSPAAFFLMYFPAGESFGKQWWEKFSKEVILGPMLAFFIWLTLTVVSAMTPAGKGTAYDIYMGNELALPGLTKATGSLGAGTAASGGSDTLFGTYISSMAGIAGYLLGIAMLLTSLKMATEYSSYGGATANKMFGTMKNWATGKSGIMPQAWARSLLKGYTSNMRNPITRMKEGVERGGSWAADAPFVGINRLPGFLGGDKRAAAARLASAKKTKTDKKMDEYKTAGNYKALLSDGGRLTPKEIEDLDDDKRGSYATAAGELAEAEIAKGTQADQNKIRGFDVGQILASGRMNARQQADPRLRDMIRRRQGGLSLAKSLGHHEGPLTDDFRAWAADMARPEDLIDLHYDNDGTMREITDEISRRDPNHYNRMRDMPQLNQLRLRPIGATGQPAAGGQAPPRQNPPQPRQNPQPQQEYPPLPPQQQTPPPPPQPQGPQIATPNTPNADPNARMINPATGRPFDDDDQGGGPTIEVARR